MTASLDVQKDRYADLLVRTGVNLQEGQSLLISAEVAHRNMVRQIAGSAYRAGARYVHTDWIDTPTTRERYLHSQPDYLDFLPNYEVERHREMLNDKWCRLALVGPEFPDVFDDVIPNRMRAVAVARSQRLQHFREAVMNDQVAWCVAAIPTAAWAGKVFGDLALDAALERLWTVVLQTCRVDRPDPAEAWRSHDGALQRVVRFLDEQAVQSLHFIDKMPDGSGQPTTDLTIGLTDHPKWLGASAVTPDGTRFLPNVPTEEVFSTPHRARTNGWVQTTKPLFPFDREVKRAWFRFVDGTVVEYDAQTGKEVLDQFFAIDGARLLGEVALVDVRSPVGQADVIFYETLFDENAASHIAFGQAYPGGVRGGASMTEEELQALGVNKADTHLDVMIGTPTMNVSGLRADGSQVEIMEQGQFVGAVIGGDDI